MTLDATPGGITSNSYVSVIDATAYLNERLNTQPWYTEPEDVTLQAQREAALITATRLLDEQIRWVGAPMYPDQALGWPRSGLTTASGMPLDPTVIPATIERATAYYALALLRDTSEGETGSSSSSTVEAGTIKRKTLGETTIEYFQPGTTTTTTTAAAVTKPPGTTLPAEIRQMLRGFGMVAGGVIVSLIRA